MRRTAAFFIAIVLTLASFSTASGGGEAPRDTEVQDSSDLLHVPWNVVEHVLPNGMRALLLQDRRAPSVVFQIWYGVGSRDEPKGKTGIAHMLEHMMFRGTKKYGPKEFSNIVKKNGGTHNAFTSYDYTAYYERMPSDRLELAIQLEADRMVNLALRKEDLDPERQVVIEERRMRTEDRPTSALFEQIQATAYTKHTYGNPIIGWPKDLRAFTLEDLKDFYHRYYKPNNATAVIVGNFDVDEAIRLLEKNFGSISSSPFAGRPKMSEPSQTAERRIVVRKEAQLPYIALAYHTPNWKDDDASALVMLETILGGGETSRLHQRLVRKDSIALSAGADYTYISLDPGLFYLFAQPAPGKTVEVVEKAIQEEIDRLIKNGISKEELDRALRSIEAQTVFSMDSHFFRAMLLGRAAIAGDWHLVNDYLPQLANVTPKDVIRVAKKYLKKSNRTTGVLVAIPPKGKRPPIGGSPSGQLSKGGN